VERRARKNQKEAFRRVSNIFASLFRVKIPTFSSRSY